MRFRWPPWKNEIIKDGEEMSDQTAIRRAEFKIRVAEAKLAETTSTIPEIARAARSARVVQYRVDRFTDEISASFRRLNHD